MTDHYAHNNAQYPARASQDSAVLLSVPQTLLHLLQLLPR